MRKVIYFLLLLFCIFLPSSFASAYSRVPSEYSDKYTEDIKKWKDDLMTVGYPAFEWGADKYYCWKYMKNDSYASIQVLWANQGFCDYCVVYDSSKDCIYIVFASVGLHCQVTSTNVYVLGSALPKGSHCGLCFASNGGKFRYMNYNGTSDASGDLEFSIISGDLHLIGFYGTCYDSVNKIVEGIPDASPAPGESAPPDDSGGSSGGGGGSDFGSSILSRIGDFFDSFFDNLKNALKDLFVPSSDFMQSQIRGLKDDFSARFNTGTLAELKDKLSDHYKTTTPEYFDKHFALGSFAIPVGKKLVHHGDGKGLLAMKSVIFEKYQDEIKGFVRIVFYLLMIISDYNFIIWLLRSAPVATGGSGSRGGSSGGSRGSAKDGGDSD